MENNTTIVTCFYKLEKSKHTYDEYISWINNFLLNLSKDLPLVIFTSKYDKTSIEKNILDCGVTLYKIVIINIEDLPLSQKYSKEFWSSQYKMDNQKNSGRSIDCYKIWNSKCDFLKLAINYNFFNSTNFVWNDIGNVRNKTTISALQKYRPSNNNISSTKIDIVLLNKNINNAHKYFKDCIHFSGSMFGGTKDTILMFHTLFYKMFDDYVANNQFIGCDQQIITSIYLAYNYIINPVYANSNDIDPWFFLYKKYSNE